MFWFSFRWSLVICCVCLNVRPTLEFVLLCILYMYFYTELLIMTILRINECMNIHERVHYLRKTAYYTVKYVLLYACGTILESIAVALA